MKLEAAILQTLSPSEVEVMSTNAVFIHRFFLTVTLQFLLGAQIQHMNNDASHINPLMMETQIVSETQEADYL
jgi:hypothetical protein